MRFFYKSTSDPDYYIFLLSTPVQVEDLRAGHGCLGERVGVRVGGGGVVAEAVERHLLLGHHFAGAVVHLRVVDADAAEDGERLEQAHVRLVELLTPLL